MKKVLGLFKENEKGSPTLEAILLLALLFISVIFVGYRLLNGYTRVVKIDSAAKIDDDRQSYCYNEICEWAGTTPIYCDKWSGYYSKTGKKNDATLSNKYLSGYKPVCVISGDEVEDPNDKRYTIRFFLDETKNELLTSVRLINGAKITGIPKNFYKEGYTFLNWSEEPKTVSGDQDFYAIWQLDKYDINYGLNGGVNAATNPHYYTYEDSIIVLDDPSKSYYDFKGWYEDATFTTKNNIIPAHSTGQKEFYAKWSPTVYSITYNLNGGVNNGENPSTYTYESPSITLKTPSRNGYTFQGWYVDSSFNTAVTSIPTKSHGNLVFYAKWKANTYSITYNLNGTTDWTATNNSKNPSTFTPDNEVVFTDPSRTNHTFKGWYTNSALTNSITKISKGTVGNITVYAKWEINRIWAYRDVNSWTGYDYSSKQGTFSQSRNEVYCTHSWTVECNCTSYDTGHYQQHSSSCTYGLAHDFCWDGSHEAECSNDGRTAGRYVCHSSSCNSRVCSTCPKSESNWYTSCPSGWSSSSTRTTWRKADGFSSAVKVSGTYSAANNTSSRQYGYSDDGGVSWNWYE